jgi:23S rRNA (adenine2503-C2)-methyltransferase
LLEGVNDTEEEIEGIVRLLKGKYALMNMIPYNSVDDLPFRRPSWERAAEIARTLHRQGILTKLRNSAGQDVEGGCGQLRARHLQAESSSNQRNLSKPLRTLQAIEAPLHFVKAKPATFL